MPHEIMVIVMTSIGATALVLIVLLGMLHDLKMAKIKRNAPEGNMPEKSMNELKETIEAFRREIAELRDTTTRYDLSFDAALQRLENRMALVEDRSRAVEANPDPLKIQAGR